MLITPEMVQDARERLSVPVVLIEEDDVESIILDHTVAQLRRVLAELEAMAPLPHAASEEAVAMHDAWIAQSERMSQLKREAEVMALLTAPSEVQKYLDAITTRELALLGFTLA
jgi:hypothetical protein